MIFVIFIHKTAKAYLFLSQYKTFSKGKNKDKILNIEYKIDEEIALELDGKEIDIKDLRKENSDT